MATYLELHGLVGNSNLQDKISVATTIAAFNISEEVTPLAARKAWAAKVLSDPVCEARCVLRYVLAANSGLTESQITGESDAAIQAKVNDVVDLLVDADAGV